MKFQSFAQGDCEGLDRLSVLRLSVLRLSAGAGVLTCGSARSTLGLLERLTVLDGEGGNGEGLRRLLLR
jgi:hypothetical protein